ncbi:MAG: hypothetical protein KDC53_25730 [Saprospiraceae bacterium]|nr:hypothetical protein [Saprospiraceae bacterium]
MKKFLLPLVLWLPFLLKGQNQAVEIESSNSGLLLPRLVDTANVSHPEEGLLIYDLTDKKPAYYNGNTWNSLVTGSNLGELGDSLTYTVITPSGANARMLLPLADGTYPLSSFSWGMTNSGTQYGGTPNATFHEVNLTIPIDANWLPFQDLLRQSMPATKEIEIKVYKSGATIPEFSMKLKNSIEVLSVSFGSGPIYSISLFPYAMSITHYPTNTTLDINLVQSP